jgi:ferredoxin-thioredoxin reductase catalytic subunit
MIKEISVNKIVFNPWNPNKMPKGTLNKLKNSIQTMGLLNPIIVREKDGQYEVIDGEWRLRAHQELGYNTIPCNIINATDEEVKKIIFASTIKGKHNALESQEILKDFLYTTKKEDLLGLNLDRGKLERKTKYIDYKKGEPVVKGGKKLKDESYGLSSTDDYTIILSIPLKKKEYERVKNKLNSIDKNWSNAIIKLIEKNET